MIKKLIKWLGIILIGLGLVLLALYIIPPKQEQIEYNYVSEAPEFELDAKVGWYTTETGKPYQVTWAAKKGLQLNYFDALRSNLKNLRLKPIDAVNFDTNGDNKTAEATFNFNAADSTEHLRINTSKTKLDLTKRDSLFYSQKEVTYFNERTKLVGLLLEPYKNQKSTAIVFIHGSGVSDRDNFWYMYQADYLARQGYLVFLPDKRGCGKSFGEWHTASFEDFAQDTQSAIAYLKKNKSSAFQKIGVIGLSQGGWISHLVNKDSLTIDFIIDIVGASTTPKEQLRYEVMNEIAGSGAPNWIANSIAPIFAKRARGKRKIWWEKNGAFDPIPLMAESKIPILKVFGDQDENVPVARSRERIEDLLTKNPNLSIKVKVFEGAGHALMDPETGWIKSDYLDFLNEWLTKL